MVIPEDRALAQNSTASRCEFQNGLLENTSTVPFESDMLGTVGPWPKYHPNSAGPEPGGRLRPRYAKSILTQPVLDHLTLPYGPPTGPAKMSP